MNVDEIELNKNVKRLSKEFDHPESGLRDILINCNGSYDMAYAVCSEMDIPQRKRKNQNQLQHSYIPDANMDFVYGDPNIQQLHLFFPDMSLEQVASVYWDSGNNVQKAANRILGNEKVYIQDEPKIELEYLHIKYSFIPSSEVTAVFIRCKNNYTRANETINEEYSSLIKKHWNELQLFERQYGKYKHRYVVEEYKRINTRYTSYTVDLDEVVENDDDIPRYVPYDKIEVLNQRHQARECLERAQVLRNYRSEQARTNGKYLTVLNAKIKRNEHLYDEINKETGSQIFKAHNNKSLEYLIENGEPIDFHGLQVQEVDQYMNRIISYIKRSGKRYRVSVITGSGNHSRNNFSTIRNHVICLLQRNRVPFDSEGGKITFSY